MNKPCVIQFKWAKDNHAALPDTGWIDSWVQDHAYWRDTPTAPIDMLDRSPVDDFFDECMKEERG